ncbi:MAG: hypothetical protein M3R61_08565 [Chloroflexota bacterium]|nr:hypothetical protein [Chloroflexota bacterium]
MPQPKKYASHADRQTAYRRRCEQAREVEIAGKGLPRLPAISTLPGWPRWNATFRMAHDLIAGAVTELQEYFDGRSESWQESERGEEHQERTASAEAALEALDPLIW